MIEFPIVTERLLLRPFGLDDAPALHAIWADPGARRWTGTGRYAPPDSVAETRGRLEPIVADQAAHGYSLWAVVEKASGRLVGDCGIFRSDHHPDADAELAYGLAPDVWGRGYATEAAEACLAIGFGTLAMTRIVADISDPANTASIRVLEKVGMRLEDVRPEGAHGQLLYAASRSADSSTRGSGKLSQ